MHPKKKTAVIIFTVFLVLVFILLFFLVQSQNSQQADIPSAVTVAADSTVVFATTTTTTTTTSVQSVPPPPADAPKYKNGTYTAIGRYNSPAGPETINVSITLTDDVVTSSSVTPLAGDGRSMGYQELFVSAYKQYVIGKPIDSIDLINDISGSSLTPKGFDDALTTIKSEALTS